MAGSIPKTGAGGSAEVAGTAEKCRDHRGQLGQPRSAGAIWGQYLEYRVPRIQLGQGTSSNSLPVLPVRVDLVGPGGLGGLGGPGCVPVVSRRSRRSRLCPGGLGGPGCVPPHSYSLSHKSIHPPFTCPRPAPYLFHRVINNFQQLPFVTLCDNRKWRWSIFPFKIRHRACLLEKREKDIKKVRWIIYHLSTIEDCTFTYLGRRQFSKISHEFLKERIEGEDNGRVTAFLKESCRQVSETCHNMRYQ